MKTLLKNSVLNGISYAEYKSLTQQLVEKESSTGIRTENTEEQWEQKVMYTKLNYSRNKRLDKTATIPETYRHYFKETCEKQTWLVITETWCGDAVQALPFINKASELSENIDLKIVFRDEHPELMNLFLTNGSKSIPKVIILDSDFEVLAEWGPRSQAATNLVNDYKTEHGKLDDAFKKQLQIWYNKDKGNNIVAELATISKNLCLEKEEKFF